jgi:hypothetical protein
MCVCVCVLGGGWGGVRSCVYCIHYFKCVYRKGTDTHHVYRIGTDTSLSHTHTHTHMRTDRARTHTLTQANVQTCRHTHTHAYQILPKKKKIEPLT